MELSEDVRLHRKPAHEIESIFPNRWSPRSMAGDSLPQETLLSLFEAARWAPSARNEQSWRFIYAHRDTPSWEGLFDLLVESNQVWCKNAAALVLVLSRTVYEYKGHPYGTHSLDTGMAVQNLLLEAAQRGLVAHPMAGFDADAARKELGVPDDYSVECMLAIGNRGEKEALSDALQEREVPSNRKPVQELMMEGKYRK